MAAVRTAPKLKRLTYRVSRPAFSEKPSEVKGWVVVGIDGLAAHNEGLNWWTVTHLASGKALGRSYNTRKEAIGLVETMAAVPDLDWAQETPWRTWEARGAAADAMNAYRASL